MLRKVVGAVVLLLLCIGITMAGGIISQHGGVRQGNSVTYTIHYNEAATIDVMGRVGGASDVLFTYGTFIGSGVLLILAVAFFILGVRLLRSGPSRRRKSPRLVGEGNP